MKIKFIRISNVLSFKHFDNINDAEKINFETENQANDLHILIGPNGAGKSNLLEIINQIFQKCLFKRFVIEPSETNLSEKEIKEKNPEGIPRELKKHNDFKNNSQRIIIEVSLRENDYQNMRFILEMAQHIDSIMENYSLLNYRFSKYLELIDLTKLCNQLKELPIEFTFYRENENTDFHISFLWDDSCNEAYKNFINDYFSYFQLIQKVIEIHNEEVQDSLWEPLRNTFVLISCYRNYNMMDSKYNGNLRGKNRINHELSLETDEKKTNTKDIKSEEPIVFRLVKQKLAYKGFNLMDKENMSRSEMLDRLQESNLYKDINSILCEFLGIKFIIGLQDMSKWEFSFSFKKDNSDKSESLDFSELSSGQKAIIHVIFSLYGYDVKDGLMIIDEPELHLHPQFQKKYLEIIYQENIRRNIQFIIVSHSPVFVSDLTNDKIQRFYFDEKEITTKIVKTFDPLQLKQRFQILNYTNTAKIFFVNKVILVEGESDEYFFRFYLEWLRKNDQENFSFIDDYEILNIGGKGKYREWKEFLEKWKIKTYFIGDWDNVEEFKILSKDEISLRKQNFKDKICDKVWEKIKDKSSIDANNLFRTLIKYLENPNGDLQELNTLASYLYDRSTPWTEILAVRDRKTQDSDNKEIEKKYEENVFILKQGELEDYLPISKGLQHVINLCNNNFTDDKLKYSEEIKVIVEKIFSS